MNRVFIIAEAGVNHNGSIELAKRLIDEAARVGADAVKFQSFKAERLVTEAARKAEYQKETTGKTESQFEMLKKLELDYGKHRELMDYAEKKKILFLSSPFDLESIDLLDELGLSLFKIPSGEITNYPYLVKIARLKKKAILSTGMADLGEVEDAIEVLESNGCEDITILHCNTEYPTPMADVNLLAMKTMKRAFGLPVGYSDHTLGVEIPIAAAAMGATVIEKHFTLDQRMPGPDHRASLEPREFAAMVLAIRNIELAMGDGRKKASPSEAKNKKIVRKSIVASCDIKAGELLTEENVTVKRPGEGLSPMLWNEIIGRKAVKDFKKDECIE
ncbi:MAG: N-acetylneuraminate synthase [Peptostreptococcaceae bacterium]|nr:N-acetylneuraminate synthase [Peptostreptococcaceae bacterium]